MISSGFGLERDDGNDQQGDDVGDLDHRVDRRPGGVLVGVADRVAGDRRGMGLRALAAEGAVLDQLLGVVPRAAAGGTILTVWPYSGFSVPSMIPGRSRNWRRTSSTTWPPARPTASIASAANKQTIIPPMIRPISTSGALRLKRVP